MFNTIFHVFLHTVKDTILTLPILFLCYLLIELLEDKILHGYKSSKVLKGKWAPVVSAGFGIIPQCGFSVVATDLFSKKVITIGSLLAILIATSDEALPIMLSNPNNYASLAIIILVKFVFAIIVGLTIDAIFKKFKSKKQANLVENLIENNKEENKDSHEKNHIHLEEVKGCCHHDLKGKKSKIKDLFVHPLIHSLKIFFFIVLFSFIFGCIVEFVGEDSVKNFMLSTGFFEPFIVSIVGLIPNCAASVLITQVFLMQGISIGSCIAGLCVNSGIAIIMLFKMNKNLKENFLILSLLYSLGCLLGVIINLIF